MKRCTKRVLVLVTLVVVAFVGLNILAFMHAYRMTHFTTEGERTASPESLNWVEKLKVLLTGVTVPRPAAGISVAETGLPFQFVSIPADEGAMSLGAWFLPGDGEDPVLVLMFHGYAAEKTSMLKEAKALYEMGHGVMLVDFRGSGESSESCTTVGFDEAEDVAAAASFARTTLGSRKLVLYGQSMGGAAVLRAVSELGVEADAVIVESVFDRLLNTIRNRFRVVGAPPWPGAELVAFWGRVQAGFSGFDLDPVEYAEDVSCPALFLHGTEDSKATIVEGRRVYEAVESRKTFIEFLGRGHENLIRSDSARWKAAVGQFLRELP